MKHMKHLIRKFYNIMVIQGVDPIKIIRSIKGLPSYFHDFLQLKSQTASSSKEFRFAMPYPCLSDRFEESGQANGHYFHQDLLVARRIYQNNPDMHVDVGSRIDGFVAHVASFRPVVVIDIRPLSSKIPNIKFLQADFMAPLANDLIEFCDSLSCLHATEHFGLGRFRDPVNYYGYLSGLKNLNRILKKGGKFYFSVPIGPQRIEFNAHRVFSMSYLLELLVNNYNIDHFSYVDDQGELHENIAISEEKALKNFDCFYGCGIFEMTKL